MPEGQNSLVKEINLPSPEQKEFDKTVFPLILCPNNEIENKAVFESIAKVTEWIKTDKTVIEDQLLKHGAILFRDFPLECPSDFDSFVKAFNYGALPYVGGAAPRTLVVGDVYTSNEAPPDSLIPFHHEMAQVPNYPSVLFFYCDIPPTEGGQTPLVPSNLVYKKMVKLESEFVNTLKEKGVIYTRVLPNGDDPTSPIGRGWQSTYGTEDRVEAEKKALELVGSIEWQKDGCLKTVTRVLPAIREDPRTGKEMWFNSIIAVFRGWKDSRNSPETSITFGDGTPMNPRVMDTLENVLNELAIDFRWQKGDVVMLDNRQALHGRRSFVPPRRILAALCK
ncbi:uncharacterized protein LOC125677414 [Ostrea edulis]|uniref:uncharacterized protein LOC125677414 n=1 Tax=Ostrea edulis TaxID=37623 RepID=UPI0020948E51|nr:uncharacterized protein LOC125677414 [Ostrea edulis]XP_056014556.1 uncharacterized protein LOC125677414 [Ostrea edulis]